MIISYSNEFVLISIIKTATTSSHALLSQFLGKDDVSTGWQDEQEDVLYGTSKAPQNVPDIGFNDFVSYLDVPVPEWPKKIGETPEISNPGLEFLLKMKDPEVVLNSIAKASVRHLTPSEMIRAGLLKEDHLEKFKFYGFIRDPYQRALSAYFFERNVQGKDQGHLSDLVEWIDSIRVEDGPQLYLNKKYKHYFTYQGIQFAKPLSHDKYENHMRTIIHYYDGHCPKVLPRFKSHYRPGWSKLPIEQILPKKSIDKLNQCLAEDIDFYNTYK